MRRLNQLGLKMLALAGVLFAAACVITTEKAYFAESDFAQPKVLSGDWQKVPTREDPETLKVRLTVNGKLIRAQPLTEAGAIDEAEEPVEFGVVALDPGRFVVAHTESDGSVSYLGLVAQEGKLAFYFFSGGDGEDSESAFRGLLVDLEISRDSSFPGEVRLSGKKLSADKIKALFTKLLDDPKTYEAFVTEYVPAK